MAVTRKPWTRDELWVALNLYHKLTFGGAKEVRARHWERHAPAWLRLGGAAVVGRFSRNRRGS